MLDVDGAAFLFGRNERSALGVSKEEVISENAPEKLEATDLGAAEGTKFVDAACGRNHSLLVGSDGHVWSAGKNDLGQVSKIQRIIRCIISPCASAVILYAR